MNDCKQCADVIDFFWERQRRHKKPQSNAIAELALDKCEEMFARGDWKGFGYWHSTVARVQISKASS